MGVVPADILEIGIPDSSIKAQIVGFTPMIAIIQLWLCMKRSLLTSNRGFLYTMHIRRTNNIHGVLTAIPKVAALHRAYIQGISVLEPEHQATQSIFGA